MAIDGPAGAGKSTVAKEVAKRLGISYLDTGAMYRVVAYKALRDGIPLEDEELITTLAENIEISFEHGEKEAVYCNGEDVTEAIRDAEVSRAVSLVASYPGVRKRLVKLQRQAATKGSFVVDGRDIGTHVLPEAKVKIFLTASVEERAKRRYLENLQSGKKTTLEEVTADIESRDRLDSQREYAPLKVAKDAIIIDTTGLTIEEVTAKIVEIAREA
ncbi:MAG TPA: (d)CMP kinase [Peptococcaceae bacterium]|nr:(d)CMP kinase [Peptococcaceae bacterium]